MLHSHDVLAGVRIDSAQWIIQKVDIRLLVNRARQTHPLPLPA